MSLEQNHYHQEPVNFSTAFHVNLEPVSRVLQWHYVLVRPQVTLAKIKFF